MKQFLLSLMLLISATVSGISQEKVTIKNKVFEVLYSQELEQPLVIKYHSTNRPTNVNRGTMDFYKEPNIKTSDADDYKANIYDKGHGAPAASFSDNMENLSVLITIHFDNPIKRIVTNAAIPSYLEKHIYFEKQGKWKCYVFLNQKPQYKWQELEKVCEP